MIAVIKGDIIDSRKLKNPEPWLTPLKKLLSQWGSAPGQWELVWGDFFQLEISQAEEALRKAIEIKALIRRTTPANYQKQMSPIDVRMAIGIGEKGYSGERISESNGPAFVYAGEKFDQLKKEGVTLAIKTSQTILDEEINLYLKMAGIFMDKWSVSSAELIEVIFHHPKITQEEIGKKLGIKQNSVSGRWRRAHVDEIVAVEKIFRKKIKQLWP